MPAINAQEIPTAETGSTGLIERVGQVKRMLVLYPELKLRTYLDESQRYHDTDSFGRDDLPLVAKLADQAHTFIFERIATSKAEPHAG